MAKWQGLSKRKSTGARLKKHHEKRKRELGRPEAQTIIGETKVKPIRTRGNNQKLRALRLEYCNLTDPNTGKAEKVRILDVEANPANKEYTRRKIMTKGALINTEKGYAIITNRPGQEGFISAIPTQFDADATQERTTSAKKKKRQTLQRRKVGSASGTPKKKKTTTKTPVKKPAPKPAPKKEEKKEAPKKAPAKKEEKAKITAKVDKEIEITYNDRTYTFDKNITMKDLKSKRGVPTDVKDKVAEIRDFKTWK